MSSTSPKPRVAHLTSVHMRKNTRIFHKMCVSLAAHGYDTHLAVADGLGYEEADGVKIHDVGKPSSRLTRVLFSTMRIFVKALRLRADIYHLHDPELMPYGILLRFAGKRVVYDVHEHYRDILTDAYYLPRWLRKTIARTYSVAEFITGRIVSRCVVTTDYMKRTVAVPQNAAILHNYVKLSEFTPTGESRREDAVCYVGILHESRGVPEMVMAAEKGGAALYLAGDYYSATLHDEVKRLPSWRNVRELGFISRQQMQDVFERARAGLLILTPRLSYNHSSCNKIYEYMAAGIPVIASDLPFAREAIEKHQCGLLVNPPLGVDKIAEAVAYVLAHPEEAAAMGRRGREAVEKEYTWEKEQYVLFALYDDLMNA